MLEKNLLDVTPKENDPPDALQGGANIRPTSGRKQWQPPKGHAIDVASNTHINAGVGVDGITCHS